MCASMPSGVIVSRLGRSLSSGSAANAAIALAKRITNALFILLLYWRMQPAQVLQKAAQSEGPRTRGTWESGQGVRRSCLIPLFTLLPGLVGRDELISPIGWQAVRLPCTAIHT